MADDKKKSSAVDDARRTVIPGQMAKDLFKGVLTKIQKATQKKDKE